MGFWKRERENQSMTFGVSFNPAMRSVKFGSGYIKYGSPPNKHELQEIANQEKIRTGDIWQVTLGEKHPDLGVKHYAFTGDDATLAQDAADRGRGILQHFLSTFSPLWMVPTPKKASKQPVVGSITEDNEGTNN